MQIKILPHPHKTKPRHTFKRQWGAICASPRELASICWCLGFLWSPASVLALTLAVLAWSQGRAAWGRPCPSSVLGGSGTGHRPPVFRAGARLELPETPGCQQLQGGPSEGHDPLGRAETPGGPRLLLQEGGGGRGPASLGKDAGVSPALPAASVSLCLWPPPWPKHRLSPGPSCSSCPLRPSQSGSHAVSLLCVEPCVPCFNEAGQSPSRELGLDGPSSGGPLGSVSKLQPRQPFCPAQKAASVWIQGLRTRSLPAGLPSLPLVTCLGAARPARPSLTPGRARCSPLGAPYPFLPHSQAAGARGPGVPSHRDVR